jgi:NAD(P)-dependent dehydrogenase (short-subunit alcohol dehydrogenase family)
MSGNRDGRLAGRTAIVTGAGQGIGEGIARAYAKEGADLVLVSRTAEKLHAVAEAVRALGATVVEMRGSVADRALADRSVSEALSAFGRLDVLVNNAHSFSLKKPLEEVSEEDVRLDLDTGFFGTFHFMQAAFPHMRAAGRGSIINFGSVSALEGTAKYAAYAATKEAIRGLTRCAARDWGKYGIRVNVINPAADSPASLAFFARDPENLPRTLEKMALGYRGKPEEDVAPVAVFLASDDSHYMTGQTLNADGGRWMF